MRKLGDIQSGLMSQGNRFGAMGVYELQINIDEEMLRHDSDREGLVKTTIATHLAGCAAETGVPVGEGYWIVHLEPWVTKFFPSLPQEFRL